MTINKIKYFKARPNGGFWSVSETHTDKIPDRVGALNELRHYTKDADNLKSDKSKLNLQNGQKVRPKTQFCTISLNYF